MYGQGAAEGSSTLQHQRSGSTATPHSIAWQVPISTDWQVPISTAKLTPVGGRCVPSKVQASSCVLDLPCPVLAS
jgi:hypothetical protein